MVACSGLALPAQAQRPNGNRPPEFASTEVSPERKVTFRIHAPKAEGVRLGSSDLPGVGSAAEMKKGDNGVWETTVGPVPAGAYRYNFQVDGAGRHRPAQPRDQRVERQHLEPGPRPGLGDLRPEGRAPRRGREGPLSLVDAEEVPPHARLHAAGLREGPGRVPGLLPAARGGRLRRFVDLGRPRRRDPRQPDRGGQGEADDRGHARRAHGPVPLRRGRRQLVPEADGRVRRGLLQRRPPLRREELPREGRPVQPGDRRPLDGRRPDAERRVRQAARLRLHRRLQLGRLRHRRGLRRRRRPTPSGKTRTRRRWTTPTSRTA